jgi:Sulfotransferase family
VVYLAGLGRSGSTLLERLLGEMPGACPAGEVVHMWLRGVRDGERCGCGQPFGSCPFWRQVGQAAFGGWDQVDVDRITRLRARVDRARFLPQLASPVLRHRLQPALDEYVAYYQRTYAAIGQISGSVVVIDSSKHASLAFCLRSSPGLDLRVVHVVRDPRAVAYSWGKIVDRPEAASGSQMSTYTPASAALRWNLQNSALQLLSQLGTPTLRVRYEDFTAAPAATLGRIAAFAGLPGGPEFGFLGTDGPGRWWAELGATHTASGNPMRFTTGRIRIRHDDTWQTAMVAGSRRTVTTLTLPLLMRYGYLGGTA